MPSLQLCLVMLRSRFFARLWGIILHILTHVLEIVLGQFHAYALRGLLLILLSCIASFLVEIAHIWPATLTGGDGMAMNIFHAVVSQIYVAENDTFIIGELLGNGVPRRRLLASSTSSRRGDPAYINGFPCIDIFLDEGVYVGFSYFG